MSPRIRNREERVKRHACRGDRRSAAFLAVNHANCSTNVELRLAQRGDRVEQRAARRDDVLDHADGRPRPRRRPPGGCRCRSPWRPSARSRTAGPISTDVTAASGTAPSSGPARSSAWGASLRAGARRSRGRGRRAARGRSRSGTCRGSSGCAGPSGARSRPRGRPARRAGGRARRDPAPVTPPRRGARSRSGAARSASGEPVAERQHRAVVEVEVDARAAAGAAAAVEDRPGEGAGADQDAEQDAALRHRRRLRPPLAAAGAVSSATWRRSVFRS